MEIPKPIIGEKGIASRFFAGAAAGSFATVWAHPGRLSTLSLLYSKAGLYGAFVWRTAGRLTAQNGGSRPGQVLTYPLDLLRARMAAHWTARSAYDSGAAR
jgi:hypothetical protein